MKHNWFKNKLFRIYLEDLFGEITNRIYRSGLNYIYFFTKIHYVREVKFASTINKSVCKIKYKWNIWAHVSGSFLYNRFLLKYILSGSAFKKCFIGLKPNYRTKSTHIPVEQNSVFNSYEWFFVEKKEYKIVRK